MKKLIISLLALMLLMAGCSARGEEIPVDKTDKQEPVTEPLTPENGDPIKHSDTTIIVSFQETPTDEQIQEIEKMCNGKLSNLMMDTIGVFKFEALNDKALNALLKKVQELDYVAAAEYDNIIELPDCSKGPC